MKYEYMTCEVTDSLTLDTKRFNQWLDTLGADGWMLMQIFQGRLIFMRQADETIG